MFILKTLKISNHPVFGSADIDFGDALMDSSSGNLMSVIIGKNGVGKSYLLRAITDIFRTLDEMVNYQEAILPVLPYKYKVIYILDGHIYELANSKELFRPGVKYLKKGFEILVDNVESDWENVRVPNALIASSMSITDKFPTPSFGIYKYKGIRSERTPSTTGTRTLVRKAVEGIIDSLSHKHTTRDEIAMILSELGFQKYMGISYRLRYKSVFLRDDMNPELLDDIYVNWQLHFKGRTGEVWGTKYYKTIKKDSNKISIVCRFLQRYAQDENVIKSNCIYYDIFDEYNNLLLDADAIKILTNLDLLSFPEFKVRKKKKDEDYDFVNSSSGETQQLCQFISIMSSIVPNSLILIDEPENSSHPNWQINYIGWMQSIFRDYRDCHFIIATHSHFLLTDLRPEWSRIIALDNVDKSLENIIPKETNAFCWSTDDILYKIFHVRNTRNHAFEYDIYKLYDMISEQNSDIKAIENLVNQLEKYSLGPSDPLNIIIESGKDYVKHK